MRTTILKCDRCGCEVDKIGWLMTDCQISEGEKLFQSGTAIGEYCSTCLELVTRFAQAPRVKILQSTFERVARELYFACEGLTNNKKCTCVEDGNGVNCAHCSGKQAMDNAQNALGIKTPKSEPGVAT